VTLVLRPYQRAAVDAVFDWVSRYEGNPLLVVPTGGGKSPIMGAIIAQVLENAPTARCLVLAHRKELLQQNVRAISTVVPFTMVGIYSAGLKTRDTASPVIVAGIQSVASKPYALGAFDVVLIDEAHLVPLSDDTSYRKVIKALRTMNPNVRFIGLTATPYRLNTGLLHRGKNPLFTDIAYEVPVRDLIEQGFLCPLISKATIKRLDTTGVATRGGEYVAGELERAVDVDDVTTAVVEEMTRLFAGRNKWLVFCAGVQHAEHVATALMLNGVMAAPVHGTLDAMTRAERLDAFKRGELRCLTSMDVLTTGYDEPAIDAIALLRPTKSAGLYVQMVGRGFRLHPSKVNTLVLDFAGNVEYFGPVDTIKVHEKKPGDGKPPTKKCPICSEICAAGVRLCPACQFGFPEPEKPPIVPEASTRPILSTEPEPIEELKVDDVMYSRHEKEGKPPSLRVDYLVGYRIAASEWICLEHTGFARTKAEQWWKLRSNDPPPATIAEALLYVDELPVPTAIKTQRDGRFTRVVAATLPPKPEPPAFPRACWSCAFYSAAKDCCQKWDATPPEDVKKVGCEAWTEEEVPF
jgi:DNA repair protein RadD